MDNMFYKASAFNADLSGRDVSKVNEMKSMFESAIAFNGDLRNVSQVNDMFMLAQAFNGDLSESGDHHGAYAIF